MEHSSGSVERWRAVAGAGSQTRKDSGHGVGTQGAAPGVVNGFRFGSSSGAAASGRSLVVRCISLLSVVPVGSSQFTVVASQDEARDSLTEGSLTMLKSLGFCVVSIGDAIPPLRIALPASGATPDGAVYVGSGRLVNLGPGPSAQRAGIWPGMRTVRRRPQHTANIMMRGQALLISFSFLKGGSWYAPARWGAFAMRMCSVHFSLITRVPQSMPGWRCHHQMARPGALHRCSGKRGSFPVFRPRSLTGRPSQCGTGSVNPFV